MRIAHVIAYFTTGLSYEENRLPWYQAELGHQVQIITADRYYPFPNYEAAMKPVLGPRRRAEGREAVESVVVNRLSVYEWPGRAHVWLRGLKDALLAFAPEIVHLHGIVGPLAIQGVRTCACLQLPLVVDSHTCYFNVDLRVRWRRLYYDAFRWWWTRDNWHGVRRFISVSPDVAHFLAQEFGIPAQFIFESYIGTDPRQFRFSATQRERLRREQGLRESDIVAIFVGKVEPRKEVEILLEAQRKLRDSGHPLHVWLVGPASPSYLEELRATAQGKNPAFTRFIPLVSNEMLPSYFSAADIAVWPGDPSIGIIEAMACALPVVVIEDLSTRHLRDAGNGAAVPRGDLSHLTQTLGRLMAYPEGRRRMGQASRQLVLSRFDWRVIARNLLQVYVESAVLENRPTARLSPIGRDPTSQQRM